MSRTILLTGATGKIGLALVRHFLERGDRVVAVGRSKTSMQNLLSMGGPETGNLVFVETDLMKKKSVEKLVLQLKKRKIYPDGCIHSARNMAYLHLKKDGSPGEQKFANEFKLGVMIPYELTMALARQKGSRLKSVVNVGSMYGAVAPHLSLYKKPLRESPIHYGVVKAALAQLTRELAVRLAGRGIRVNCAAFGGVEGRVDRKFARRYAALTPSGRMLSEKEIPGPIDMLLSEAASGVTGHVLMVDGGWTAW